MRSCQWSSPQSRSSSCANGAAVADNTADAELSKNQSDSDGPTSRSPLLRHARSGHNGFLRVLEVMCTPTSPSALLSAVQIGHETALSRRSRWGRRWWRGVAAAGVVVVGVQHEPPPPAAARSWEASATVSWLTFFDALDRDHSGACGGCSGSWGARVPTLLRATLAVGARAWCGCGTARDG
jgi:hypothetical protein